MNVTKHTSFLMLSWNTVNSVQYCRLAKRLREKWHSAKHRPILIFLSEWYESSKCCNWVRKWSSFIWCINYLEVQWVLVEVSDCIRKAESVWEVYLVNCLHNLTNNEIATKLREHSLNIFVDMLNKVVQMWHLFSI